MTTGGGPPKLLDYDASAAVDVREREHVCTAADSLEICKFFTAYGMMHEGLGDVRSMAEVLSVLTGVDFSEERLHQACDRIYNVERAYLVKNGVRREDDVAPRHFYETALPSGISAGKTLDRDKFEELKDAWYDLRGQDRKTGAPKRETLEALGLNYVADDMEKTGVYKEGK
jgi:aldehyde:ferredoxin oxidoreductase